jgi:hypothetical protein
MAMTKEEKVMIRHHCGFLNVTAVSTFALGTPAAVETQFIIEGAMDRILPEAEGLARRCLAILDKIEGQMVDDVELLAVVSVDEITVNGDEQNKLKREYVYWRNALCNLMGIYPNPFDKRNDILAPGFNVPVNH